MDSEMLADANTLGSRVRSGAEQSLKSDLKGQTRMDNDRNSGQAFVDMMSGNVNGWTGMRLHT